MTFFCTPVFLVDHPTFWHNLQIQTIPNRLVRLIWILNILRRAIALLKQFVDGRKDQTGHFQVIFLHPSSRPFHFHRCRVINCLRSHIIDIKNFRFQAWTPRLPVSRLFVRPHSSSRSPIHPEAHSNHFLQRVSAKKSLRILAPFFKHQTPVWHFVVSKKSPAPKVKLA